MRIIGGEFRSRIFKPGKNFKARPTTDFARENLFNILNNRYVFEDLKVLDLFAGTGSISFEFVSRGCEDVTMIELDHVHFSFIYSVIKQLGISDAVKPIKGDVFRYIERLEDKFNLIFADPPYALKRLPEIPDLILSNNLLADKDSILILEHGKTNDFSSHPNFSELRVYGSVHFSFFSANQ
jgi:16S rRNA (guanine(966)-N(2))-methyltransferase RsmD